MLIRLPPLRYFLPNLFTLAATFCGFAIIHIASTATDPRHFYLAASLIPLACVLDGLDGRIARLFRAQSLFGVQFDSLSDFLTFGVAPAFLIYHWALHELGVPGLLLSFLFAAAAMTRLARFNVDSEAQGDVQDGPERYFEGLSAPMGGMAIAAVVGLDTGFLARQTAVPEALPGLAVLVGLLSFLMVSSIPFRTFKDLRWNLANRLLVGSVLATVVVVAIVADHMVALSCAFFAYMLLNFFNAMVVRPIVRRRAMRRGEWKEEWDVMTYEDDEESILDPALDPVVEEWNANEDGDQPR